MWKLWAKSWVGLGGRPLVRPWALAAPVLVLMVSLPLIRLRKPAELAENEKSRLATVQAIVEQGTLVISDSRPDLAGTADRIVVRDVAPDGRAAAGEYSKLPPVMSALMAGWYWILNNLTGLTFAGDADYLIYLLTVLTVTLPVAGAAGMVYRLGRIFELPRPWRAGLGVIVVCGSGLVSYATVISSNALAASLVIAAAACLFHVAAIAKPVHRAPWLAMTGFLASLAAVVDLGALVFLVLLGCVLLALRWPWGRTVAGVALYVGGALPPLLLHAALTIPVTGDMLPGFLHPELSPPAPHVSVPASAADELPTELSVRLSEAFDAVLGWRGLVSHFPVILVGVAGIVLVLRRHWPPATKLLATVSLAAGLVIVITYLMTQPDWLQPMFSARWFILFLPLLVFWAGAWLRNRHHPITWAVAAILLAFSMLTSLVGATNPFMPTEPGQYTAYAVAKKLFQQPVPPTVGIQTVTPRR